MPHSIVSFHFSPYKIGQILRQYAKERNISQTSMQAKTGLSYDTIGNIYAGKVQKIPFEYLFKFCIVMEIPIEVIMMLMLKDEDIDFKDKVLLYDTVEDVSVPVADAVPSLIAGPVPDEVADAAVAVAAAAPVLDAAAAAADLGRGYYTEEDINSVIKRVKEQHSAHINDLKSAFEQEREAHRRHCEQLHALAMGLVSSR